MRRTIGCVAALILPILLLTGAPLGAQNKKDKDKDADADGKTTPKMIKMGQVAGQIVAVYEEKRKIRLKVTQSYMEINPGALQNIQNAQVQMAQAQAQRNLQGIISARNALMQAQATLYQPKTVSNEHEISVADDAVIRTRSPRQAFDEKGKIKKFTKAELKELKGDDPKLPGYKAEYGDLTVDQIVSVQLVRKKPEGPPAPRPKLKKGKGADDDAGPADLMADNTPVTNMVMILADPMPMGGK